MRNVKIHDYAEDDSTQTMQIISAVTAEGCIISEREYEYEEEDENSINFGKTLTGIDITLSVPQIDTEAQVYRTLEELAEQITAEELTLVED